MILQAEIAGSMMVVGILAIIIILCLIGFIFIKTVKEYSKKKPD